MKSEFLTNIMQYVSYFRLSKAMGNNLSDGNPSVANLSDPFRPEKMAEKFSQLYDDEWTSAFEVLTSMFSMDEKMAADCLLNVAKVSINSTNNKQGQTIFQYKKLQ